MIKIDGKHVTVKGHTLKIALELSVIGTLFKKNFDIFRYYKNFTLPMIINAEKNVTPEQKVFYKKLKALLDKHSDIFEPEKEVE